MTTPRKKPINSRRKGTSAELELAKVLTGFGFPAGQGRQKKGGADSPDMICPSLKGFYIEAKITGACKMHSPAILVQWDAQAQRDSEGKSVPTAGGVRRPGGCGCSRLGGGSTSRRSQTSWRRCSRELTTCQESGPVFSG
ncbi:hypothetical protein [Deinococcus altitudinis]|uniref:hypothetical protein n=1 Tax=Deinococcus altitudinis TaxID=468914 RepID=UPI00389270D8